MKSVYLLECYRDDATPLSDGNRTLGGGFAFDTLEELDEFAAKMRSKGWETSYSGYPVECES